MSISKLKQIDQTKLTDESLKAKVIDFINEYEGVENVSATEQSVIDKLTDKANKHIQDNEEAEAKRIKDEEEAEAKRIKDEEEAEQEKLNQEKQLKLKQMAETVQYPHLEYLKSVNKTINDYSKEIKQKHLGWNLLAKKYEKNPENEKAKETAITASNKLLTFIQETEMAKQN